VTDNESIKAGEGMQQGTKRDDIISELLPNIISHGSSLTEANKGGAGETHLSTESNIDGKIKEEEEDEKVVIESSSPINGNVS
jgi:hypothetical protein